MSAILFCKNTPVYDIEACSILNEQLLPGHISNYRNHPNAFREWSKIRYSAITNSLARHLKGLSLGQGRMSLYNQKTYALSLSDCYWIKDSSSTVSFEEVSPYYQKFWTGDGVYEEGAIPTIYTGGFLPKEWISSAQLRKQGPECLIEEDCSDLCKACGIKAADVIRAGDEEAVLVSNITSPDFMLEQANQSGKLDVDDFDNNTIIDLFGVDGMKMILIDAIVGNGDRHAGNFGWLRDTATGEYIGMAPLYDFDHALDSKRLEDILIRDAIETIRPNSMFRLIAIGICACAIDYVMKNKSQELFAKRAQEMKNILMEEV